MPISAIRAGTRMARNTLFITIALVGQKILSFVYFAMIAREMGVEDTGRYFLATSFALLFSVVADLGFAPLLIRESAKLRQGVAGTLSSILGAKLFLTIVTFLLINSISLMIPGYDTLTKLLILLASVSVLFEAWNLTWYGILRGWQRLEYESLGILIGQGLTVGLGLIFLFTTQNLFLLILALLIGNAANFVWALLVVHRRVRVPLRISFSITNMRAIFLTVIPFALAAIFSRVMGFSDTFLLSVLGDETMVGLYSVPFKLTFALQFIPLAFAATLLPAMSDFAKRSRDLLRKTYVKSTLYLFFIALPAALGLVVLADQIIPTVFGVEYIPAITTLQILALTLIFLFMNFPIGSLLVAVDRQKTQTVLVGIAMLTSVGVNIVLIPKIGILAPAIASVAASAVLFLLGIALVRKIVAINGYALLVGALKAVLSGAIMVMALMYLRPSLHLAVLIPLGALVYIVSLLATRAIHVAEIRHGLLSITNRS